MTRLLPFEGIENFRDFGDYAAGTRRLRRGLLYRSAHHAEATEADLARLAELGVSVIVDLRRSNERQSLPSRRWNPFAAEVIDNDIGQEHADEWHDFIARSDLTAESFRLYMLDYYDGAPHAQRHLDLYSRYFQALARTQGAVLVHCAAGKDRTGILCALTHHLAGVHPDDIIQDYLLTNDEARIARRLPTVRARIAEASGREPSDAALQVAMRVEAEYLERAFAVMRARHGSIDGYLDEALGLTPQLRERLHDRLLG